MHLGNNGLFQASNGIDFAYEVYTSCLLDFSMCGKFNISKESETFDDCFYTYKVNFDYDSPFKDVYKRHGYINCYINMSYEPMRFADPKHFSIPYEDYRYDRGGYINCDLSFERTDGEGELICLASVHKTEKTDTDEFIDKFFEGFIEFIRVTT